MIDQKIREKILKIEKEEDDPVAMMLGEQAAEEYRKAIMKDPMSLGYPEEGETGLERIYKEALVYRDRGQITTPKFPVED